MQQTHYKSPVLRKDGSQAAIVGYFMNRHLHQVAVKHAVSECYVTVFIIKHLNHRDFIPKPVNKESFCLVCFNYKNSLEFFVASEGRALGHTVKSLNQRHAPDLYLQFEAILTGCETIKDTLDWTTGQASNLVVNYLFLLLVSLPVIGWTCIVSSAVCAFGLSLPVHPFVSVSDCSNCKLTFSPRTLWDRCYSQCMTRALDQHRQLHYANIKTSSLTVTSELFQYTFLCKVFHRLCEKLLCLEDGEMTMLQCIVQGYITSLFTSKPF